MLAPRASSAFVCIRCELRLAHTRLPAISSRASRATFSTSSRHQEDQNASDSRPPYQFPNPKSRGELSQRPLGRLWKRKGKASIRETTARLGDGVKSLGDDTEILVLREEGDAPPEEMLTPHVDMREPIDILGSLVQEESAVGQDDVNSLLESLRPRTHAPADEPQYISQAAYSKLSNVLKESFTLVQLLQYYLSHREPERRSMLGIAKKPVDRTEWHPGTTQITNRISKRKSAFGAKRKRKPALVDQILRYAWNIIQLEEIEAPGEIEITLQPWELHLLTLSNPTPLDRIGRERKAKIEIHSWDYKDDRLDQSHTAHVLRITADKSTAEYAADDVQDLLKNAETERFSLEPWLPFMLEDKVDKNSTAAKISPEVLASVGKLSETYIQISPPHSLLIRGMNMTSVEQAKRGLLQILPLKGPTRHIDSVKLTVAQREGHLVPTPFKNFLDTRYRSMGLGRWSLPVAKTTSKNSPVILNAPKSKAADKTDERLAARMAKTLEATQRKFNKLGNGSESEKEQVKKSVQDYTISNRITAEFGQLLVPLDTSSKQAPNILNAPFCHVFPGLSSLLTNEAFSSSEAHSASPKLEYEFVANPAQENPLQGDKRHPGLVMTFVYQQGSKPVLANVIFKVEESVYDVPLPDRAVDVRFKISQEIIYSDKSLMITDPNIKNLIDVVIANIESGERLTAPSKLTVSVPNATVTGYDADVKGDRSLEYFFTEIRYRQSFNTTYQGETVTYNHTRAGKLAKKGGTLSTYYDVGKGPGALKSFLKKTFRIADLLTETSGNNKAMSRTVRPRDQMSARKLKRLGMAKGGMIEQDPENHEEYPSRNDDLIVEGEEQEEEVDGPTPALGASEGGVDRFQDEVKENSHQIEDGELDGPYMGSFLTEEQWTGPQLDHKPMETASGSSPTFSNVDSLVESAEEDMAEVAALTESTDKEPNSSRDDVLHIEKKEVPSSG